MGEMSTGISQNDDRGETEETALDYCNVFVKYLPHHFTEKDLQELFQEYGKIMSVKVMVDPQTGSSLGYGFVRFAEPEQAQLAIDNLSRKKIGDRTLLCKLSNSTGKNANLYVKPLNANTTEETLKALFESFGEIIECKVIPDKHAADGCVGFVRFVNCKSAENAIQTMNGTKTENEVPLVVRFAETAQPKPQQRRYHPLVPPLPTEYVMVPQPVPVPYMIDPMGYPIPIMGPPAMPYPPNGMPPLNLSMTGTPSHMNVHNQSITSPRGIPGEFPYNIPPQFSVVDEPNLFIFHLPPDVDDEGLKGLFSDFGPIESAKVIIDKNTGDSKGYGFVQFVNHSDAERALSMNGRSIGCKRLSVSFKTPSPRNSPRNSPRSPRQYGSPRTFFVSPR